MNLIDVTKQMKSEDDALEFLEQMRWPKGVRCPTCGCDKVSRISRDTSGKNKRSRIYSCLESTCRQQFSATNGTLFNDSHLPVKTWFMAIALIMDAKKGISAKQLQRHLGLGSYKTAWYLCHRIRKAMEQGGSLLTGTVEIDETYIGGKQRGHKNKLKNKDCVLGIRERGGELRLRHVPNAKADTVYDVIAANVDKNVERIVTDESKIYNFGLTQYRKVQHDRINHISGVYVRGDVHTNTIESAFSLLKRGIVGNFHQVSIKHLHRYLGEFEFRFNNRENEQRFGDTVMRLLSRNAMPYKRLIAD